MTFHVMAILNKNVQETTLTFKKNKMTFESGYFKTRNYCILGLLHISLIFPASELFRDPNMYTSDERYALSLQIVRSRFLIFGL